MNNQPQTESDAEKSNNVVGCLKLISVDEGTFAEVYEQISDATYPVIFGSINKDFDSLVLTSSQIEEFVKDRAEHYLLEAPAPWTCFRFLTKVGEEFIIEDVRFLPNRKRDTRKTNFLDGSVRHAEYHHRIVVPWKSPLN